MQLQYIGFEQVNNVREYIFHGVAHGEETKVFVVSTDLDLFRKNHVGMQEGPALCLRILTTEMDAIESSQPPPLRQALTDQDMVAYVIYRGVSTPRKQGPRPRTASKTSLGA